MTSLIAVLALIAGLSFGISVLGGALLVIAMSLLSTAKEQMLRQVEERIRAERQLAAVKEEQAEVARAIERNSLPWIAKSDKMEARYETEAMERLERPEFSYADVVEGLGGTR